ncbi:MAG TPA: DUF1707 domain-containing protein [Streptosporangiaceae bacterium]|nr:DUF1707 domain-containing protein [Streptosporangiaceae bacterium]
MNTTSAENPLGGWLLIPGEGFGQSIREPLHPGRPGPGPLTGRTDQGGHIDMSAPGSPPRTRGYSSSRGARYVSPDLRVSDAERAEAADRLAKHYSDGRLDQAELDERLDRAMKATTGADLTGLFDDLPGTEASEARVRQGPQRQEQPPGGYPRQLAHPRHSAFFLLAVILITVTVGQALVWRFSPWLLIALLALLCWRYEPWHRRR